MSAEHGCDDSRKPTPEQQAAISARGCDVLVSASAGTGKTKVLVDRVIDRILDPSRRISVDRLLVVTFTEAAAAQMRERIGEALLKRALEQPGDGWLAEQLALLPRAPISTLHSWCLALIRDNFHQLGLDPAMRVLDEHEAELLRLEVLDRVFEERYERGDDAFLNLVDCYGDDRGDEPLRRLVLDLHSFVRGLPDPQAWLARAADAFSLADDTGLLHPASRWAGPLMGMLKGRLLVAIASLRDAISLCSVPGGPLAYTRCLGEDLARLDSCAEILDGAGGDWAVLCASAAELLSGWPRLPAARGVAEEARKPVQDARNRARRAAEGLLDTFLARPEAELRAELRRCHSLMAALAALVTSLHDESRRERAARGLLDFNDFEHYALSLLRSSEPAPAPPGGALGRAAADLHPSALACELRERYAEVLVDEYQDINDIQYQILRLVSRGNLFCIGDDKQSIYRFRGTNPGFFRDLRARYGTQQPGPGAGCLLGLTDNFRSRPAILDAVNFVFRQIMSAQTAEIDYDQGAFLKPGSCDYKDAPDRDAPVELYVLERGGGPVAEESAVPAEEQGDGGGGRLTSEDAGGIDGTPDEPDSGAGEQREDEVALEARYVAERILAMVGRASGTPEFSVYDTAGKRHRPVSYGDIAVLLRAVRGRANRYLEVFARYGVPVTAELPTGYFAAIEVETMLALLEVIDNPRQDIPLAAVLRSPLVGLNEPALASVRLAAVREDLYGALQAAAQAGGLYSPALRAFLERLEDWRTAARRGPLGDLVWRLLQETDYLAFCGGLPAGGQRQANLLALYERAREFDRFARQGLPRFLRFIRRLHEAESDLGARSDHAGAGAVLLTSIHKAKGLEFPVVFLPDLGRQMRHPGGQRDVLWHRELGLGALLANRELGIKHPTLAWHLVDWMLGREELAEEMRVLYVAMTRARERLVLGGSARGLDSRLRAWAAAARPVFADGAAGSPTAAGVRVNLGGPGRPGTPGTPGTPGEELPPDKLPDELVTTAATYLDWVCFAVARHPDGAVITDAAGDADALDAIRQGPFGADPSRWKVAVTLGAGAGVGGRYAAATLAGDELRRIASLEPLGFPPPPEMARALDARLGWQYPAPARPRISAKLYASELRIEDFAPGPGDDADAVQQLPSVRQAGEPWPGPDFSPWGARPAAPALRRGMLTHLVLQRIELRGRVDLDGLREQVSSMQRSSLLRPDEAGRIDLDSLAWFFETADGRRLLVDPAAVRREIPFMLAVPAPSVLSERGERVVPGCGGVAQDGLGGEMIVVQGIIDCLVQTPEGWVLLDFKTDRVSAEQVAERAAAYTAQLGMYVQAVREILGGRVCRVRLVFLHPRVIWTLPLTGWGPEISEQS